MAVGCYRGAHRVTFPAALVNPSLRRYIFAGGHARIGACENCSGTIGSGARLMVRLVRQHVSTPPDCVMTTRRSIPLILILVATAALTAGFFYQPSLPHPRDADREQLVRWLVSRDLRGESNELRLALVQRLEEEFSAEMDWDSMSDRLTQPQQKRLRDNLVLLLRPWFMSKLNGYFSLPASERVAYVDRLLDTISLWSGVDTLQSCNPEDLQGGQSLLEMTFNRLRQIVPVENL